MEPGARAPCITTGHKHCLSTGPGPQQKCQAVRQEFYQEGGWGLKAYCTMPGSWFSLFLLFFGVEVVDAWVLVCSLAGLELVIFLPQSPECCRITSVYHHVFSLLPGGARVGSHSNSLSLDCLVCEMGLKSGGCKCKMGQG
jgi:hypothetical protein